MTVCVCVCVCLSVYLPVCLSVYLYIYCVSSGGTNVNSDRRKLAQLAGCMPDIVVATPGRLLEHLEETPGFAKLASTSTCVLVYDEADRLLEMGFKV